MSDSEGEAKKELAPELATAEPPSNRA